MNSTKAIRYEKLIESLKKENKITIVSCNTCVRLNETGGEDKLEALATKLRNDGFNVRDGFLITMPCQDHYMNNVTITPDIDTIILLACSAGCSNALVHFPKQKIVPALEDRGMMIIGPVKLNDGTIKVKKTMRRTKR